MKGVLWAVCSLWDPMAPHEVTEGKGGHVKRGNGAGAARGRHGVGRAREMGEEGGGGRAV